MHERNTEHGSVYAALRIAQAVKAAHPQITIALGGGFVNTELRELAEPRLFDFVDVVTLDAGERPLLALIEHLQGQRSRQRLVRYINSLSLRECMRDWRTIGARLAEVSRKRRYQCECATEH